MSRPTFEILKAVATDGYQCPDWTAVNVIGMPSGCLGYWQGHDVEDPQYIWFVVAWESLEHHRAVMDDTEQYPLWTETLSKMVKKVVFVYHVQHSDDFLTGLDAPITEFVVCTVDDNVERDQFQDTLVKLLEQLQQEVPKSEFCYGGWGPVVEDNRKFMVGHGWKSLESCQGVLANAPVFATHVSALRQIGIAEVKFAKLVRYPCS